MVNVGRARQRPCDEGVAPATAAQVFGGYVAQQRVAVARHALQTRASENRQRERRDYPMSDLDHVAFPLATVAGLRLVTVALRWLIRGAPSRGYSTCPRRVRSTRDRA